MQNIQTDLIKTRLGVNSSLIISSSLQSQLEFINSDIDI